MASINTVPVNMYQSRSYHESVTFDVPDCMYKLNNIHKDSMSPDTIVQCTNSQYAVEALEARQEAILRRLNHLQAVVSGLKHKHNVDKVYKSTGTLHMVKSQEEEKWDGVVKDIVINASPEKPPLSVLVLCQLLSHQVKTMTACYSHSSVVNLVPERLTDLFHGFESYRNLYQIAITVIWKKVSHGPYMIVNPVKQTRVEGEASIARYLSRLLAPAYDLENIVVATEIDNWVDMFNQLCFGNNKEKSAVLKAMNVKLGNMNWLVGDSLSLADIILWSAIQQSHQSDTLPNNVKNWLQACNNTACFQMALKAL